MAKEKLICPFSGEPCEMPEVCLITGCLILNEMKKAGQDISQFTFTDEDARQDAALRRLEEKRAQEKKEKPPTKFSPIEKTNPKKGKDKGKF